MSDSRAHILGAIRTSLGGGTSAADKAALEAELQAPKANLVPARGNLPHGEKVDLFLSMAEKVDAEITRVADEAGVPQAVADFLAGHNLPPKIRMSPDQKLDSIPWADNPLLEIDKGRAVEADQVSGTPVFAAIAETGTLMLASGPGTPITLNFLPENHIAVVRASEVVGAYEEAWARLRQQAVSWPGGMPRAVNMVTGPSRTADIEQKLYLGAHGPRRLKIVLIDDGEA